MSTTAALRAITVSESLQRREAVKIAISEARLSGLAPSPDVLALFERFVEGELTEDELLNAVLDRQERANIVPE